MKVGEGTPASILQPRTEAITTAVAKKGIFSTATVIAFLLTVVTVVFTKGVQRETMQHTGFSPVTAYSSEQVSPATANDLIQAIEHTQELQRQASWNASLKGDTVQAQRLQRSHAEAEEVKRNTRGMTLRQSTKEVPSSMPSWALKMVQGGFSKDVPVGRIIAESAKINAENALKGAPPCNYPEVPARAAAMAVTAQPNFQPQLTLQLKEPQQASSDSGDSQSSVRIRELKMKKAKLETA